MLRPARPLAFVVALCAATPAALTFVERPASASAAISLTVQDLVDRADAIVVAIPKSRVSRWENGKIVTYTTISIDTNVAGAGKSGDSMIVRTLGGTVDKIGQQVSGEATLPIDTPMVLFLRPLPAGITGVPVGARSVVGMAQGALRINVGKDKIARLEPHLDGLALVPQQGVTQPPAHVALAGRSLADATNDIRAGWSKRVPK
jgi:hypothetical protein